MITRCAEKRSNEPPTIDTLEGIPKDATVKENSKKGINETEIKTKEEKNMKKEPCEKKPERLLVTAKEAPAYNREVLLIIIFEFMIIFLLSLSLSFPCIQQRGSFSNYL